MLLADLTSGLSAPQLLGCGDVDVKSIVYDSREATTGSLFVAIRGENVDGHDFAEAAVQNGAAAVVAEREIPQINARKIPLVITQDSRAAMAALSARFYDYPSRKLKLIGVTGTKGKTTTTHLIAAIFRAAGLKTGIIGTLGSRIGDTAIETKHTTPESVDLQRVLARMVGDGVQVVAMEVSSHGLVQRRVGGCEFDCGVFTNLTREHLDYHNTMDEYLSAKLLLFSDYAVASAKRFASVVNRDDPAASRVMEVAHGDVLAYSVGGEADVTARDIQTSARGVSYALCYQGRKSRVSLKLGGLFNVYNSLAAGAAAISQGVSLSQVADGLSVVDSVAGRFESVDCGQSFTALVDYAHAPDALENVLRAARELTDGKLIVVFGCGGNRDRGKRPIMGRIASELADVCVVTSDNPRKEDPESIIREILEGIEEPYAHRVVALPERREAIRAALGMAAEGDLVLIAGKGHEDYQIFADRTIHFDDREVVREILCDEPSG